MSDHHQELFEKSKKIVPGGVHSPVRSFKGLPMAPRFIQRADSAFIYDIEGKEYIDFCMSFGPMILGHRNKIVEEELKQALERGWSYGACEPYSLELAEFLVSRLSHVDQIRFVNSGTEAVMTAIRLARGHTGKNKIIKFDGCYHGHLDSMLIKAGSGLAGQAEASSAGVPEGVAQDTLILDLDDLAAVEQCFEEHPNQIAAIIVEPLPANNGLLIQSKEYLQGLKDLCQKHNALLIFDEVISGFRVAFGGMAEKMNIMPDLVTYGKIIGGGMPVGAVAGKSEILETLAPAGPVYQAGTLSANPLAMVAGLATLKQLDEETYQQIESNKNRIVSIFKNFLNKYEGGKYEETSIVHSDSLFWMIPGSPISKVSDMPSDLAQKFAPVFTELLNRGVYIAPNAYEVGFVSAAHDYKVCDELERRLSL